MFFLFLKLVYNIVLKNMEKEKMKSIIEKIGFSIINKINQKNNSLSIQEFESLFAEHKELKNYFINATIEMPIINHDTNSNSVLHIPLMNLLFLANKNNNNGITEFLWLKYVDEIEPFKEVFLENHNGKNLVHCLDLFTITEKNIPYIAEKNSLNIQNMNQFYHYVFKNNKNNTYFMQDWHYDRHIKFNIGFESLFLNNWNNNIDNNITIKFNSVLNPYINIEGKYSIIESNLNEASKSCMYHLTEFIKYKLYNNEIDFTWNEDKITTLMQNNLPIFGEITQKDKIYPSIDKQLSMLLQTIIKQGYPINKEMLSLLLVSNKNVFNDIVKFIENNNICIYEKPIEVVTNKVQKKLQETNNTKTIESFIIKYESTDSSITDICKIILKKNELLDSIKGLEYLSENVEDKFNVDKIFNNYIPKILSTYFDIPTHIRLNSENGLSKMTMEQLAIVNNQLEKIENSIFENELIKMKILGRFLNDRFPESNPDNAIYKVSHIK